MCLTFFRKAVIKTKVDFEGCANCIYIRDIKEIIEELNISSKVKKLPEFIAINITCDIISKCEKSEDGIVYYGQVLKEVNR